MGLIYPEKGTERYQVTNEPTLMRSFLSKIKMYLEAKNQNQIGLKK